MRKFQIANTLLYLLGVAVLVVLSMRASDGHLIYTLDDPYIHLAVAENILRGSYGVNLSEFSSPSSSIAWPFLLCLALVLGLGNWGPLLIGVIATGLSVWLISGYFWRYVFGAVPFSGKYLLLVILAPLLILSINGIALPMTGMEHPLHVLGCVLVILGLTEMVKQNQVPMTLIAGIVLCPLIRFEGLALSLAAIAAIAYQKRFSSAFVILVVLIAFMGSYAFMMTSLGLPALPSSVLVKSNVTATALDGSGFSVIKGALEGLNYSLSKKWGALFLLSSAFLLMAIARSEPNERRMRLVVGLSAILALMAHIVFGKYDSFGRYEVYAVAIMLMSMVVVYSRTLLETESFTIKAVFLVFLLGLLAQGYIKVTLRTPAASRNIYEQQYQMHRFATEYFPHTVAVNDLGWVAYQNDNFVLDLWGLGSEEARRLALTGGRTPDAIQRLTRDRSVSYAMLYDDWFGFKKAIPEGWCRIAVLRTSQVTTARDEVAFYLLAPQKTQEMMMALASFQSSLPEGSDLSILGCSTR